MNATLTETEQRLCLFLSLLDEDVTEQVLQSLPASRREALREGVTDLLNDPPAIDEVESVVDEFERIFKLLNTMSKEVDTAELEEPADEEDDEQSENEALNPVASGAAGSKSIPGMEQLLLLEPARLAAALREEQPQVVSVLIRQLNDRRAGEVLAHLPTALRSDVMMRLTQPLLPSPRLVEQLVQATLRRAVELDPNDLVPPGPTEQRMARVLRAMSRKDRMETLDSLTETDPELAQAIQDNMFCFEDLLRLDDRSVKTLLGEIESESLALALKGADIEYMDRIVSNLSRRAGETLKEEVDFMPPPSEDEREAARARVVQVICKLDQEGALQLRE
ncbi:MAG: hypothetical protein KDB14_02495 [Planctomycetales bacterium]|nr:hypothetical protein [Planctomycetales bacterium]